MMGSKLNILWVACAVTIVAIVVGFRLTRHIPSSSGLREEEEKELQATASDGTPTFLSPSGSQANQLPAQSIKFPATVISNAEPLPLIEESWSEEDTATSFPTTRVILRAKVLDRQTGVPVPGVIITASRWETTHPLYTARVPASLAAAGAQLHSDMSGTLEITGIPAPAAITLRLAARGYDESDVGPFYVTEQPSVSETVFFLSRHPSVSGRTVRVRTHEPLGGVRVEARGQSTEFRTRIMTATSQPDGRFELRDVPSGRVHFVFTPPKGTPFLLDISLSPGAPTSLGDIELGEHGARVFGKVVRGSHATAVTSATVLLHPSAPLDGPTRRAVTDAHGRFEFANLSNGPYTIEFAPSDMEGSPDVTQPTAALRTQLTRPLMLGPEEEREVVLRLGDTTLQGRLLRGNQPSAGMLYFSRGAVGLGLTRVAHVGADGRYELRDIDPGRWIVTIRGPRGDVARETIEIPPVATLERDFALPTGWLVGRVVSDDGRPVIGAQVELALINEHPYQDFMEPRLLRARTKSDGSFALGPLASGTYTVRASHPTLGWGISPLSTVPQIGNSAPTEIVLRPAQPATLRSVALSFETGKPIREAFLVVYDSAGRLGRSISRNDAGVAIIDGLAPGTYQIHVSASGYTSDDQEIVLHEGEIREVVSVLGTRGALRVFAEDASGQPIAGARVWVHPENPRTLDSPREGQTDEGGLWVTRALSPGNVAVEVHFPSGESTKIDAVIRPRETTEITVRP